MNLLPEQVLRKKIISSFNAMLDSNIKPIDINWSCPTDLNRTAGFEPDDVRLIISTRHSLPPFQNQNIIFNII